MRNTSISNLFGLPNVHVIKVYYIMCQISLTFDWFLLMIYQRTDTDNLINIIVFVSLLYCTDIFHVAVPLFSNLLQRCKNVVRTKKLAHWPLGEWIL